MTTQVLFSGYGRWGIWNWDEEKEVCYINWVTDSCYTSGIFSLTSIDDLRYKHTKSLDELNVRQFELSLDEEDCAFRRSKINSKFLRDFMEFHVDSSKSYLLEAVRDKPEKPKKVKKNVLIVEPEKLENKTFINIQEASAITGLSQGYIYKLTSKQKIPHSKPGGKNSILK